MTTKRIKITSEFVSLVQRLGREEGKTLKNIAELLKISYISDKRILRKENAMISLKTADEKEKKHRKQ